MAATPPLKTDQSSGATGRVAIANAYMVSLGGAVGITPHASIALDGNYPDVQQPSSGVTDAAYFPGAVVAIGPVPADTSGNTTLTDSTLARQHGAGTITMPATPWEGMRVLVMDADGAAQTANIIVAPNSGQSIQNPYNASVVGASTWKILIPWQCIELSWDGAISAWRVVNDSHATALPTFTATNTNIQLTGRAAVKVSTSTTPVTVTMTASPTDGMVVWVKDVGGNSAVNNITVSAAGAGWVIQNPNLTGGTTGASATLANNRVGARWRADVASKIWWAECIL